MSDRVAIGNGQLTLEASNYKRQIPNKFQGSNLEIQNERCATAALRFVEFGGFEFEFVCDLFFGSWNFQLLKKGLWLWISIAKSASASM